MYEGYGEGDGGVCLADFAYVKVAWCLFVRPVLSSACCSFSTLVRHVHAVLHDTLSYLLLLYPHMYD